MHSTAQTVAAEYTHARQARAALTLQTAQKILRAQVLAYAVLALHARLADTSAVAHVQEDKGSTDATALATATISGNGQALNHATHSHALAQSALTHARQAAVHLQNVMDTILDSKVSAESVGHATAAVIV